MVFSAQDIGYKTIHVSVSSKHELRRKLDAGVPVFGVVYEGKREIVARLQSMPHRTRVCLRRSPVRTTFAVMTWDAVKGEAL